MSPATKRPVRDPSRVRAGAHLGDDEHLARIHREAGRQVGGVGRE